MALPEAIRPPAEVPVNPLPTPGQVAPAEWLALLARGDHRQLTLRICDFLESTARVVLLYHDQTTRLHFDTVANLLLFILAHPGYRVPDDLAIRLINQNHAISSLVANSSFRTSDAHLEALKNQPANLVKILALYSARNHVYFDPDLFFRTQPLLASTWFARYAETLYSTVSFENSWENLRRHFGYTPSQLIPVSNLQDIYFGATYVAPDRDHLIRQCVNDSIRRHFRLAQPIENTPNPRKIALISRHWRPEHSIYRVLSAGVAALRPKYHLTLFHIDTANPVDASMFDEVRVLPTLHGVPDLAPLSRNDFYVIYYPEIGMGDETIYLSNLRLAPLQIASFGHPVSTHGSLIDYFLSGADLETPDHPERFFSERLVLLPGMGCVHNRPLAPRPAARPVAAGDRLVINCIAMGQKLNYPFLRAVQKLLRSCARRVFLRFFAGDAATIGNDLLPLRRQLADMFGADQVEVPVLLPYDQYLAQLAEGALALDAFPFAGGNTVCDSIYLRIPVVFREGDRCYNRLGSSMLRAVGVPELITHSEDEYIALARRLIEDDAWRSSLRQRLQAADLDNTLFSRAGAADFRTAIDYLIENHARLQAENSRAPIRIRR
jgi:hypothetical protein